SNVLCRCRRRLVDPAVGGGRGAAAGRLVAVSLGAARYRLLVVHGAAAVPGRTAVEPAAAARGHRHEHLAAATVGAAGVCRGHNDPTGAAPTGDRTRLLGPADAGGH